MAGFFQPFLRGALDGFADSPYLRDYQHASKIFTPAAYGNAPKFKWLFHVYFDINKYFLTNLTSTNLEKLFPSTTNYGLLVKSVDLPKYTINLAEMNQYNRKRYVQTKISYDPIRIVFHDDNANQVRHLWFNYFSYYYNDPNQPDTFNQNAKAGEASAKLNERNIYNDNLGSEQNWGYVGETGLSTRDQLNTNRTKAPFFKSIRIYGFNQHNWALYEIVNPIIETFTHDNYNYYQTRETMENSITFRYETVKYYDGALDGRKPWEIVDGFGNPNEYDTTLSPLSTPGTNRSITGQSGLVDAIGGISEDLANGNIFGALQTAARTGRTFRNTKQVVAAAKSELITGVVGAVPSVINRTFNFPGAGATNGAGQQNVNRTNALNTGPAPVETRIPTNISRLAQSGTPGP